MAFQKAKGLFRWITGFCSGIRNDGPFFGYREAMRWHAGLLWDHIRSYGGLPQSGQAVQVQAFGKPVWLRRWTSDYAAYQQVFVEKEYGAVENLSDVAFIMDCGANIGFASIYFLNLFPKCKVLAVEPDPTNFEICERNLRPYGDRAKLVRGGIWSHSQRLTVVASEFGVAAKWGMQVRPFQSGDPEASGVDAFDIPTLMGLAVVTQIDLLKIDIERSERVVFSAETEQWLPRVRHLVIELHDGECSSVFFSALKGYDYKLQHRGDLTYCLDLNHLSAGALKKQGVS